jgi:hypothetical protein
MSSNRILSNLRAKVARGAKPFYQRLAADFQIMISFAFSNHGWLPLSRPTRRFGASFA